MLPSLSHQSFTCSDTLGALPLMPQAKMEISSVLLVLQLITNLKSRPHCGSPEVSSENMYGTTRTGTKSVHDPRRPVQRAPSSLQTLEILDLRQWTAANFLSTHFLGPVLTQSLSLRSHGKTLGALFLTHQDQLRGLSGGYSKPHTSSPSLHVFWLKL